jgi:dihydroorotate dehydrogenase
MDYYPLLRPLLFLLPPETAHTLAVRALRSGLVPPQASHISPALNVSAFNLQFPSPVGMAAGFDKNAEAMDALLAQGFGFVEVGTCTPKPQTGNAKPRMFRLREDEAVINRLGFNNLGKNIFCDNLRKPRRAGIVGANIGKNKDSDDAIADYVTMFHAVSGCADYITVNISSPNTAGLRALQERAALDALLQALQDARGSAHVPLLLKIAPDIDEAEQEAIAEVVLARAIDGLIVSNTTIARPHTLISQHKTQAGGLSGKPLMSRSTQVLANMYRLTGGKLPLIGVGGIASAEDAYAKIRAGATLVQLYSALVYQGFALVPRIHLDLAELLARDGFTHIGDAVGVDVK